MIQHHARQEPAELVVVRRDEGRAVAQEVDHDLLDDVLGILERAQPTAETALHVAVQPAAMELRELVQDGGLAGEESLEQVTARRSHGLGF
jgi:hypothetical protein